jgi:hypothetical protein
MNRLRDDKVFIANSKQHKYHVSAGSTGVHEAGA